MSLELTGLAVQYSNLPYQTIHLILPLSAHENNFVTRLTVHHDVLCAQPIAEILGVPFQKLGRILSHGGVITY